MSKILIVDDEFTVRYAVRSVLVDAGHDVLEARDGEEALSVLAVKPIDVVVIDIIMPKKEGVETTALIRCDHPSVRVVAISGGGRNRNFDFLEMAHSFGAHAILRKPFTDEQLLEAISEDQDKKI